MQDQSEQPRSGIRRRYLLPIIALLLVATCGLVGVGWQAVGIAIALIAPPMPPVPPASQLADTTTDAIGRTIWHYEIEAPACDVLDFYASRGDCTTRITCPDIANVSVGQRLAHCSSDQTFTNFTMRWEATLTWRAEGRTNLTLSRFVSWTGSLPPPPTPFFVLPP